nr:hypothetical protein [Candidatus Sigynarchaeota archaeon]
MVQVRFTYITTGDYPVFVIAKCLDHRDTLVLIESLHNLEGVEEVKTQMVLDRIKEDPTVIIPDFHPPPSAKTSKDVRHE